MAKAVVVYGGVSVAYQLRELARGCNILIGTPGRLLDFIGKEKVGQTLSLFLNRQVHVVPNFS